MKDAKFELGDLVYFSREQFMVVRRDYRSHSGNWHYLLRGDKWRIEDDLSLVSGKEKQNERHTYAKLGGSSCGVAIHWMDR